MTNDRPVPLPVLVAMVKHLKPRLKQIETARDAARGRVRRMTITHSAESVALRNEVEACHEWERDYTELSDALVQAEALIEPPSLEDTLAHFRQAARPCTCGALAQERAHSISPWCPALDPPSAAEGLSAPGSESMSSHGGGNS